MVHGNYERLSKAWVSNLKPDFVPPVPNDLFCVTSTVQLLIVHFIPIKSLQTLITATFFCSFFQLPLDSVILNDILFFFSSPDYLYLSAHWWTSPGRSQEGCEQCSADHTHPVWKLLFVSCHSTILMQSFQLELHLVLISHLYTGEIAPYFTVLNYHLKSWNVLLCLSWMLKPVGGCWFDCTEFTETTPKQAEEIRLKVCYFLQQDPPCVVPLNFKIKFSYYFQKL